MYGTIRISDYENPNRAEMTFFWYRRDLRLDDNVGLYCALKENACVQPIFIFDTEILNQLSDKTDKRVNFIHEQLDSLKNQLAQYGADLWVYLGKPTEVVQQLINEYNINAIYTNRDYEPYAKERDTYIEKLLTKKNILFKTYKDQVIFEKEEILKKDGSPYTVYSPFMKQWKKTFTSQSSTSLSLEGLTQFFHQAKQKTLPTLEYLGFETNKTNIQVPILSKLDIKEYDKVRNRPDLDATSRLSIHLRFGTVSIRKCVEIAMQKNETFLNELIWREFFMMLLWHFPQTPNKAFKSQYDQIEWRNNEIEFKKWCQGKTGFPIIDAGMRELNETGFMHNRVRMIVASFLVKDLLIDWRWGEAYFAEKLLDYDMAQNVGNWQWVAGSGADAAPYFRIFNPELQTQKFDPNLTYIKKWVPELNELNYRPMIDRSQTRERTLNTYKIALN